MNESNISEMTESDISGITESDINDMTESDIISEMTKSDISGITECDIISEMTESDSLLRVTLSALSIISLIISHCRGSCYSKPISIAKFSQNIIITLIFS